MKYTSHLLNSFLGTPHTGTISGADVVAKVINKETGDAVKIFMVINDGIIENAKFQACGSVVLFASLSAIMDIIIGKTIEEANVLTEKQVIKEIKQVNRCDYAMVTFAINALSQTISNYYKKMAKQEGIERPKKIVRVKTLTPKNSITEYNKKDVPTTSELEIMIPSLTLKKDEHEPEVLIEENLDSVSASQNIHEVLEFVPTKIEVRIMEEEPTETLKIEEHQDGVSDVVEIFEEKVKEEEPPKKGDDVIDEIDSITAKLTDAITKLNFKFDIDEEPIE